MHGKQYVAMMAESLQKKRDLLTTLLNKTKDQEKVLSVTEYDEVNWQQFEVLIEEKDIAIDKIDDLDDGFEQLFAHVREEIDADKESYKDEIKAMQALIKEVTDLGVSIGVLEERNRKRIDKLMTDSKLQIKKAKKSIKVSSDYIKSMYGTNAAGESLGFDDKK